MQFPDELRPVGPGRYATTLRLPWGQEVPAELLVASRRGWSRRPESRDPRWAVYEVGPAVVAIRLPGGPGAASDVAAGPASVPVPGTPPRRALRLRAAAWALAGAR